MKHAAATSTADGGRTLDVTGFCFECECGETAGGFSTKLAAGREHDNHVRNASGSILWHRLVSIVKEC